MKLDARHLTEFLKKPTQYRAVLLYGPDEGLIRERRKLIAAKAGGGQGFGATEFSEHAVLAEPQKLYEALSAFSLLGDTPPVILRDATDKLTPLMKDVFGSMASSNFLILTGGELAARSSLRGLFEGDKSLGSLACYADEGQTIEQVARGFFNQHGIKAEAEVFAYLRANLGNDRAVTLSELEKIHLYLGEEKELTPEIARALVGDNKIHEADALAHAVLDGELRQIHLLSDKLLEEGVSEVMILRTLSRHVERLMQVRRLMSGGLSADRAVTQLRPPVFFKEKAIVVRQAAKKSGAQLEVMLAKLLGAELACKQTGDTKLSLRRALIQL